MNKILVDTSVWVNALNGVRDWRVARLEQLIDSNAAVVLCPTVLQEILQGISNQSDYNKIRDTIQAFEMLSIDPVEAAYGAADLYRHARKKGITIRKSTDCLIAFYCIEHNAQILHHDRDFDKIAECSRLKIHQ